MLPETQEQISKIRQFNRYYTNLLGVLDRHSLQAAYRSPRCASCMKSGALPAAPQKRCPPSCKWMPGTSAVS